MMDAYVIDQYRQKWEAVASLIGQDDAMALHYGRQLARRLPEGAMFPSTILKFVPILKHYGIYYDGKHRHPNPKRAIKKRLEAGAIDSVDAFFAQWWRQRHGGI